MPTFGNIFSYMAVENHMYVSCTLLRDIDEYKTGDRFVMIRLGESLSFYSNNAQVLCKTPSMIKHLELK